MPCEACGAPLPPKRHGGGHPRKFCSTACKKRAHRARERVAERERYARDPERAMSRTLRWRRRRPDDARVAAKKSAVKRKYGLALDVYEAIIDTPERCAICLRAFDDGLRRVLDHHHGTGRPRGVLCSDCNTGLGLFNDDASRIARAVEYLTNTSPAQQPVEVM